MKFRADLHIHSCLSPCASLDMSPRSIVRRAKAAGLNALAVTDHNSALNGPAVAAVCKDAGMHCFFGLEIITTEEAHALCLFDRLEIAVDFSHEVDRHLPEIPNRPDQFGDQALVNERDEVECQVEKYLVQATDVAWSEWNARVCDAGGLFIPAHIDRPVFGVLAQLSFLPDGHYAALEATRHNLQEMRAIYEKRYPILVNSDAHHLEQIGGAWNEWEADEWSLKAFSEALHQRAVRPIIPS